MKPMAGLRVPTALLGFIPHSPAILAGISNQLSPLGYAGRIGYTRPEWPGYLRISLNPAAAPGVLPLIAKPITPSARRPRIVPRQATH